MGGQRRSFADQLTGFAAAAGDPRLTAIAARTAAPLRVAVSGRRGAGVRTVGCALRCAGVAVTAGGDADLTVRVVAETVKPEDITALEDPRPVLVVLNKADLPGGAEAADVAARIGAPVAPLAGLLAVAALDDRLDDTLWAALQVLAVEPADLSCADRFVSAAHRVPPQLRARLCDTFDLPGISAVLRAVRCGDTAVGVRALLRRLSGIDPLAGRVAARGAALRYRRLLDAVAQLEALAVGDERVADFLSSDDAVLARMAAAVEVVAAAGFSPDGDAGPADPGAQLRRATRWRRYSAGPVDAVHRGCGTDIARGALRLWARAGGSA